MGIATISSKDTSHANLTRTIEAEHGLQIPCKCGYKFFVSDAQIEWYQSKGLEIPCHCPKCRAARREAAKRRKEHEAA